MTTTAYSITEWAFLTEHPQFRRLIKKDPIAGWILYRVLWDYSARERTEVFRCWADESELASQLYIWTRVPIDQILSSLKNLFTSGLVQFRDGELLVYGSAKKHCNSRYKTWREFAKKLKTPPDVQTPTDDVHPCTPMNTPDAECTPVRTHVHETHSEPENISVPAESCTCVSENVQPCTRMTKNVAEHEHEHEQVTNNLNMNKNKELREPNAISNPVVPRVAQDSENPDPLKPCTMCAAPLGKTPKLKDLTAVGEDGKRILTPEGEAFISEFHDCLIAESSNGKTGRRMRAYNMLVEIVKLNATRSVALISMEPLTATLYLCSALIDTNTTPPQLLISLMKKRPDLGDTRIYSLVKAALNSEPASTAKNTCKNEELW